MPLTDHGRDQAMELALQLRDIGGLDIVYHDWLSRCRDTARAIEAPLAIECWGPRPWRMGWRFEGQPITPDSIQQAEWFVRHPQVAPDGGEPWGEWYWEWMGWLRALPKRGRIGVVTHNRNIQAALATVDGVFNESLYNCDGPDFCSVNKWNGVWMIRHGETDFGT